MTERHLRAGRSGMGSIGSVWPSKVKCLQSLLLVFAGLFAGSVVQESVFRKPTLMSLLAPSPVASQSLDSSKGNSGMDRDPTCAVPGESPWLAMKSAQLGVRDIVIYGGPGWEFNGGSWHMMVEMDELKRSRAGYQDYLAIRKRDGSLSGFV